MCSHLHREHEVRAGKANRKIAVVTRFCPFPQMANCSLLLPCVGGNGLFRVLIISDFSSRWSSLMSYLVLRELGDSIAKSANDGMAESRRKIWSFLQARKPMFLKHFLEKKTSPTFPLVFLSEHDYDVWLSRGSSNLHSIFRPRTLSYLLISPVSLSVVFLQVKCQSLNLKEISKCMSRPLYWRWKVVLNPVVYTE